MGINEFVQIGNLIKKLRIEKGLTQKGLAELANIPYSTYSNYENNNREPNAEQLTKIATALDVSAPELLAGYFNTGIAFADTPAEVSPERPIAFPGLEKKAEESGYRIIYGTYENSDGIEISLCDIFIEYPDGDRLYIKADDLDKLNDEINTFLKFRLEELRKKKKQK